MWDRLGVKQINPDKTSRLPWIEPPAGYIILIQDVAYGNRYKIARHQQLDARQVKRGAKFPFETRVARIYQAEDAARAERALHDELAAGSAFGDWFDLERVPASPLTPTKPPAPARPRRTVSLRDLAQNDERAESLLQDAKVVEPTPPPSSRRRPVSAEPPATRRRRNRRSRWVVALALLCLVGLLVAEHSSELQGFIETLVDQAAKPASIQSPTAAPSIRATTRTRSASPTAEPEETGEIFYTKTRARARACANVSCQTIAILRAGSKIAPLRYVRGQQVNGSDRWIAFRFAGELRYVHESLLSRVWPLVEPSPEPSPTLEPSYTPEPSPSATMTEPPPTATDPPPTELPSTATSTDLPPTAFTADLPTVAATDPPPTELPSTATSTDLPPTATATVASRTKYVVKTAGNANANIRACPSTACDIVASFAPGTNIDLRGRVTGETVYGINVWLEIEIEGGSAYIHSVLAVAAG